MALKAKSLFLYGFTVTTANQNIPFKASGGGSQLNAVITAGDYSLSQLATAIAAAMNSADPANTYTVTVNRTTSSGTQNRITIATSGTFLSLLFATGTTAPSSIYALIAFTASDYTGATTYTNAATAGSSIVTAWYGNNYQPPDVFQKNFGTVNVSTNGTKEAITWTIQRFIGVEFKYEAQATVLSSWNPFITWMIQQKPFDFTPETTSPTVFYPVTLEKSSEDGKGLGFNMKEMIPDFPFLFTTGAITMRVIGEG